MLVFKEYPEKINSLDSQASHYELVLNIPNINPLAFIYYLIQESFIYIGSASYLKHKFQPPDKAIYVNFSDLCSKKTLNDEDLQFLKHIFIPSIRLTDKKTTRNSKTIRLMTEIAPPLNFCHLVILFEILSKLNQLNFNIEIILSKSQLELINNLLSNNFALFHNIFELQDKAKKHALEKVKKGFFYHYLAYVKLLSYCIPSEINKEQQIKIFHHNHIQGWEILNLAYAWEIENQINSITSLTQLIDAINITFLKRLFSGRLFDEYFDTTISHNFSPIQYLNIILPLRKEVNSPKYPQRPRNPAESCHPYALLIILNGFGLYKDSDTESLKIPDHLNFHQKVAVDIVSYSYNPKIMIKAEPCLKSGTSPLSPITLTQLYLEQINQVRINLNQHENTLKSFLKFTIKDHSRLKQTCKTIAILLMIGLTAFAFCTWWGLALTAMALIVKVAIFAASYLFAGTLYFFASKNNSPSQPKATNVLFEASAEKSLELFNKKT